MNHLTPVELVDFVEDTLEAPRARHVSSCERCRARADRLRGALAAVRDLNAPEPSPLFWDRFSARVRAAVAAEPTIRAARVFPWHPVWGAALAGTIALLVVVVGFWRPTRVVSTVTSTPTGGLGAPASDWLSPLDLKSDDESWALVTSLAGRVTWDDADRAGLVPTPDAVAGEVFRLSPEERSELARLIRAEPARGKS
jgi:hypothetical protein